ANRISSSGVRGLEDVSQAIADKTDIVRHVNDYAADIAAQTGALRAYAFSGRDQDKARMTAAQARAEETRRDVMEMLAAAGEESTATNLENASHAFDEVFTAVENRLGNQEDALQVVAVGIGKLEASSKALAEFLQAKGGSAAGLTKELAPLVARYNQASIEFVTSGAAAAFETAISAGEAFDGLIRQAQVALKGTPRREMRVLIYARRDADVIRQSLRAKHAAATSLDAAMEQLETASAAITEITIAAKLAAREQQGLALTNMVGAVERASEQSMTGLVVGALIAALLAWYIGFSVAKPLSRITDAISRLAAGDKAVEIPGRDRGDELGRVAEAAAIFKDKAFELERLAEEKMEAERRASEIRRQQEIEEARLLDEHQRSEERARAERREARQHQRLQMADAFEAGVMRIVETVASASHNMAGAASQLVGNTEQTSAEVRATQGATDDAAGNVEAVATATEELSVSFRSVSQNLDRSAEVAQSAVDEASRTTETVAGLSIAANQIGSVVKMIRDIAEQTNLLALNATIEAARAGDAGRGFAVVASEVKNLAAQSSRATEDIAAYVEKIQDVSNDASGAIERIGSIIEQMNEVTQSVVASVQEQAAATDEIARNVQQVSASTEQVRSSVAVVDTAARETRTMTNDLQQNAESLMAESSSLKREVERFLEEVRDTKEEETLADDRPSAEIHLLQTA
ncbi:MAG: HAMP domain-containing protein, partial [Alphaproteobacteria bacterium]|nr:HAMP domain-containing protein [Alphaproteobacteria bacterium]